MPSQWCLVLLVVVGAMGDSAQQVVGLGASGPQEEYNAIINERQAIQAQLQAATARRDGAEASKRQAQAELDEERAESARLTNQQSSQFNALEEKHRQEMKLLNADFSTAMSLCRPRLHKVQALSANHTAQLLHLRDVLATIANLTTSIHELQDALPGLAEEQSKAQAAVPPTEAALEQAAAARDDARASAQGEEEEDIAVVQEAEKAYMDAVVSHQEAAQNQEWATRHKEEAEAKVVRERAALEESELAVQNLEASLDTTGVALDEARHQPSLESMWPSRKLLGSGNVDLNAERHTNTQLNNQVSAAGQLEQAYVNQRGVLLSQAASERSARTGRTAAHEARCRQEEQRHSSEAAVLRGRFVRVMALCQRQAWQVDVAKRAVKSKEAEHKAAIAKAADLGEQVKAEGLNQAAAKANVERSAETLAQVQGRLQQASAAGDAAGVAEAQNKQTDAQDSKQRAEQTLGQVQGKLQELEGTKAELDAIVSGGETALAALKESVKSAATGNCFHGDCESLHPEGPSQPQETKLGD